jgi:hypothetical protein
MSHWKDRFYAVKYVDADGRDHHAICRTRNQFGVVVEDDSLVPD